MSKLGKLTKLGIEEMRKIWPLEEKDLSPWIKDNIDALNEVLNLQIEIEKAEEYVHNFRLDLAGTDSVSQMPVVIENQFGLSNHDHLGKLITYSAAKEAGIMIWVANGIQVAHRDAINWLNTISPAEMTFYGIELELFRIDGSLPAPHFRIAAGPLPSKRKQTSSDEVSPRNKRYQQFFDRLRQRILNIQTGFTRAKALPQSWWGVGVGRSGFSVTSAFTIDSKFRVELYLDMGNKDLNNAAFAELNENRTLVSEKIGVDLVWDLLPASRACRAYVATDGTIDDNDDKLAALIEWAAPLVIKFRETFAPLVKNIEIAE